LHLYTNDRDIPRPPTASLGTVGVILGELGYFGLRQQRGRSRLKGYELSTWGTLSFMGA
jgi:hypothetical protein